MRSWPQVLWSAPLTVEHGSSQVRVTGFSLMIELEALCIALSSGELLLLGVGDDHDQVEVGVLEGGVASAQLSPDGELLAVASGDGKLLLMNKVGLPAAAADSTAQPQGWADPCADVHDYANEVFEASGSTTGPTIVDIKPNASNLSCS